MTAVSSRYDLSITGISRRDMRAPQAFISFTDGNRTGTRTARSQMQLTASTVGYKAGYLDFTCW
jgi:hypothetical protein